MSVVEAMIKHHLQLKSTRYLQKYMMYSVTTAMNLRGFFHLEPTKGDDLSPPAAYAPFFDDHKQDEEGVDGIVNFMMMG